MNDGDRTRDHRNHNPALYQLSYAHHFNYSLCLQNLLLDFPHSSNKLARPAGVEPATYGLEGRCSIQLSYGRKCIPVKNGRGRGIRTPDPLLPKQMRYQAALCPDFLVNHTDFPSCGMIRTGWVSVNQQNP